MKIKKTIALAAVAPLVVALLAVPFIAGAVIETGPVAPAGPTSLQDLTDTIGNVVSFIALIFWAIVIVFFLYAAWLYLTSGGDEEKVKTASRYFLYTLIALAIAIFAGFAPDFISNVLEGN